MSTLFSLKEKVIVVTGGAGILGTGFVEAIAGAGGAVAIIDLNEELATQNANRINAAGGKALAVKASVLSEEDLTAAREKIVAHFGKIDGLVNAAGGNVPEGVLQPDADVFALNIEGMKKAIGALNPEIDGFDASCFDGVYVTGDITAADIERMNQNRGSAQEDEEDTSRLALPNAQEA